MRYIIFHVHGFMVVFLRRVDRNFLDWFVHWWPAVGLAGWPLTFSLTDSKKQIQCSFRSARSYYWHLIHREVKVAVGFVFIIQKFLKCQGYSSENTPAHRQLSLLLFWWAIICYYIAKNVLDPLNWYFQSGETRGAMHPSDAQKTVTWLFWIVNSWL